MASVGAVQARIELLAGFGTLASVSAVATMLRLRPVADAFWWLAKKRVRITLGGK
jgi:hypothetical protein